MDINVIAQIKVRPFEIRLMEWRQVLMPANPILDRLYGVILAAIRAIRV